MDISNKTHIELRDLGLEALYSGRYSDAVTVFLAYIEKEPNHNTIHAYLSEAYYGLNQYEKALNSINRCIELEGPSYQHRLGHRIKVLMALERFQEAANDKAEDDKYNEMMNKRGNDPDYYMYR